MIFPVDGQEQCAYTELNSNGAMLHRTRENEMSFNEIIAAAIKYGPNYVGGIVGIDRRISAAGDKAGRNFGAFMADMEEMFPEEMANFLGE